MTGPRRVRVLLESWQIECCGTPPGIGDRVEWSLVFDDLEPGAVRDPVGEIDLDAVAVPVSVPGGGVGPADGIGAATLTRLEAGGVHAHWRTPDGRSGPVQLTGQLIMERHSDPPYELAPTIGTVARVRIVTRQYVEVEPRMYRSGPERPRYRDVDRSPKFFGRPEARRGTHWKDDGVVVDLVVDGTGGS